MNAIKSDKKYNETYKRIADRFRIMEEFSKAALTGDVRSSIYSGPAGLGKSFTVEKLLKDWDPEGVSHIIIKGFCTTVGLVRMLYQHRHAGHVIVFDDCDSMFFDETSMNLLKTICDTCEDRVVSYISDYKMVSKEDGELVPERFEFDAAVIFLTNLDLDAEVAKDRKISPHMAALISRSHYIDLSLKSADDYLVRIDQVVEQGMLKHLSNGEKNDVLNFVYANKGILRELSLRMVIKLAGIRKMKPKEWQNVAKITCCRS